MSTAEKQQPQYKVIANAFEGAVVRIKLKKDDAVVVACVVASSSYGLLATTIDPERRVFRPWASIVEVAL
jgi:hypothetical protein